MSKPFRPLLAATIESNEQLDQLSYPLIASPKVDGIRIICHPSLGPVTRSLKPIKNVVMRGMLSHPAMWGLDGEVVSGPIAAPDVFNRTTSAVMTVDGTYSFTYNVFDSMHVVDSDILDLGYRTRLMGYVTPKIEKIGLDYIKLLPWRVVSSPQDVLEAEAEWLPQGFEGVMLRHPQGPYKWGRSTLREQTLMKLKRFSDAEAAVIGFEELFRNTNEPTRNIQGLQERSSHNAGKVPANTLGNLLVESASWGQFAIGSGFDSTTRQQIWNNRDKYLGKIVKYKFQNVGIVEKPRFPIWLGFRED